MAFASDNTTMDQDLGNVVINTMNSVMFHKSFLNNLCSVVGSVALLKEDIGIREYCCYERVYLVCNNIQVRVSQDKKGFY